MAIDKSIDYVEQDGYKNYIKNSKSVTVPKEFKSRSDATPTKLAYITKDEAKMLKKMKKNTPHKGPSGVPSYDDYDAETGSFRSGAAMSAAESGKNTSDTLAAGMSDRDVQDIRSSVIAAGAGQRVNPGFFDSRDTVSPAELARAKAFNPTAFRQNRGGGILNFITSGGLLGNLARGLGQRLGLGKRFNEPTYDMRGLDSVNPVFDDGSNEDLLSLIGTGGITNTVPFDADTFDDDVNLMNTKPKGGTTLYDEFIPGMKNDDNRVLPKNLDLGNNKLLMASSDVSPLFRNMITRTGGLQDPVTTKLNEQKDKIEALQKSDAYEFLSEDQKNQLQKDLQEIINDLNLKQVATSIET